MSNWQSILAIRDTRAFLHHNYDKLRIPNFFMYIDKKLITILSSKLPRSQAAFILYFVHSNEVIRSN